MGTTKVSCAAHCCYCQTLLWLKNEGLLQVHHGRRGAKSWEGDERGDPAAVGDGRRFQRPVSSGPAGGQRLQVEAEPPHRERDRVQPEESPVHRSAAQRRVTRTG